MTIRRLTGRCANGAERDAGITWHAVEGEFRYPTYGRALCGAMPGRLSNGWSNDEGIEINCLRCRKKVAAANV